MGNADKKDFSSGDVRNRFPPRKKNRNLTNPICRTYIKRKKYRMMHREGRIPTCQDEKGGGHLRLVDGTAGGTFAQTMEGCATVTTDVWSTVVVKMAVKGKAPIEQKDGITDDVLHADAEEKIEGHADTTERNHVRHPVDHIGLLANVVDNGKENDDERPYASKEKHDDARLAEGVEGGIKEEFLPNLRTKVLDASVEGRQTTHAEAEKRGIETADIVEMYNQEMLFPETLNQEKGKAHAKDGEEKKDADIRKIVDKARDGVVGNGSFEEHLLGNPPHRLLVACEHHPYTVAIFGRNNGNVRHHHLVVGNQRQTVGEEDAGHLPRKSGFEGNGIGSNEIEILPKMMLLTECHRVDVGRTPKLSALRTVAMTRRQGKDKEQKTEDALHKRGDRWSGKDKV